MTLFCRHRDEADLFAKTIVTVVRGEKCGRVKHVKSQAGLGGASSG
jgi:hypothetical protein